MKQSRNEMPDNQAFIDPTMGPSDELQVYYNSAYMKEKERFNAIYGIIEPDDSLGNEKETVYIEPSADAYVPIAKYKKTKKALGLAAILAVVFGIATAVLAFIAFS